MGTEHSLEALAAAELADRYIEIILSTHPDLLIAKVADLQVEKIAEPAQRLAQFRQSLINHLAGQPHPDHFYEEYDDDD